MKLRMGTIFPQLFWRSRGSPHPREGCFGVLFPKNQAEVAAAVPLTCALFVYSSCLSLSFSSPSEYLWMAKAKSPSLKALFPCSFRAAEHTMH